MRTTLTLDDDVAMTIEHMREAEKLTLKEIVNRALREGLKHLQKRDDRPVTPYRTKAVSAGRCLIGDFDDVTEALVRAEGEDFR